MCPFYNAVMTLRELDMTKKTKVFFLFPLLFGAKSFTEINQVVLNDPIMIQLSQCAVTSKFIWGDFEEWTLKKEQRAIKLANANNLGELGAKVTIYDLHRNALSKLKYHAEAKHQNIEGLAYDYFMKHCNQKE